MFLTNPTIEELQELDLPVLLDMLTYQSAIHSKLAKSDGTSGIANTSQQLIINIQTAIQRKKRSETTGILTQKKTSGNSR